MAINKLKPGVVVMNVRDKDYVTLGETDGNSFRIHNVQYGIPDNGIYTKVISFNKSDFTSGNWRIVDWLDTDLWKAINKE